MDRHHRPCLQDVRCDGCFFRRHHGFQRAWRLERREYDHGAVDRQERHVERCEFVSDPPPIAMKQRVARMNDSTPTAFNDPTVLRVAKPIHRRCRVHPERADAVVFPHPNDFSRETVCSELCLGVSSQREIGLISGCRCRAEHWRAVAQRHGYCAGIGMVGMEMSQKRYGGGAWTRRRRERFAGATELYEWRGVLDIINHQRLIVAFNLNARPAQSSYSYKDLFQSLFD